MFQGNTVNYHSFEYYARLGRVKKHVEQYYTEEISLENAAQIAATEKTYFSTFFREKVGITFTEWLREIGGVRLTPEVVLEAMSFKDYRRATKEARAYIDLLVGRDFGSDLNPYREKY